MSNPVVTVYSKERCVQCTATKRWLKDRNIDFSEEDATDEMNLEALKSLGYMQAPVTFVRTDEGEFHWSGFDTNNLEKHLLAA